MKTVRTVSIVILHYQATDITIKCIEYINSLNREAINLNIVVVDNASPNDSGVLLKKKYLDINHIHVITNKKNEGFARGNNIGYSYAKHKLNSDLIIVINNDVMIHQKDFLARINNFSEHMEFEIIAPDIRTNNNSHQNPYRLKKLSNKRLLYGFLYNFTMRYIYILPILNRLVLRINNSRPRITKEVSIEYTELLKDIVPHGACIIYSKRWIENEDIAFLPYTFMYGEEDILYEYVCKKSYKTCYYPEAYVNHIEDVSTSLISNSNVARARFKAKYASDSLFRLIRMRVVD